MRAITGLKNLHIQEYPMVFEALGFLLQYKWKIATQHSAKYLPAYVLKEEKKADMQKEISGKQAAKIINGIAWRLPFLSSCMLKALAAHRMLQKRGVPHTIHFGVYKSSPEKLEAHAWLSINNEVLIGGGGLAKFTEVNRMHF
jgi:hypothetical protein